MPFSSLHLAFQHFGRAWGWRTHMRPAQDPAHAITSTILCQRSWRLTGAQGAIHYLSPTFNNCGFPPGPANYYHNAFSLMSGVLYPMSLLWTVRP